MQEKLKRELGLIDVFAIAAGAMISSGLFILPALAYAKSGPAVILAYILAGVLVIPTIFSKAELATAMPKAGGTYFFIERSMGAPLGTVGGLASWLSLSFKSAFALLGLGIFATVINPAITEVQIKLIGVTFCLFFMFLNIIGAKHSGRIQIALVLFLIAILLLYLFHSAQFIKVQNYVPFMPYGIGSVFATAGLVFVSFGGLTKICSVAEEVKDPGRNIPLGMFAAFFVVMVLYATVVFVTVGLLSPAQLGSTALHLPISAAATVVMGKAGGVALAIAGLLAFVSTANAGILTASRAPMAMSRDYLLPKFFQKISPKFKTPYISIIFTSLFMMLIIWFLKLEYLVKTASALMILLFLFVNIALIVMRESQISSYRPKFKAPFYPWIQLASIVGYTFLIFEMGQLTLSLTAAFIAFGFIWYLIFAHKKVKRQAALVHIIERITAKEFIEPTLPDELKEIILERDEIIEDRFDRLIKEAVILDIDGVIPRDLFFLKASKFLAAKLAMESDALTKLFIKREEESHTIIKPGLAIPHIIIEGKHKFNIVLARAKNGIVFPGSKTLVNTVFLLVGTQDERNFHLRALAAIAQIMQDEKFEDVWLAARNAEELRNIILLAERKRFEQG